MAALDEGLRWVEVRLAELVDGAPPDAVQIRRKDGPRSWPVHALIKHEGMPNDVTSAEGVKVDPWDRLEDAIHLHETRLLRSG